MNEALLRADDETMGTTTLRHFDYLDEHDADLESALGLSNLSKDIHHWRCFGMDYPDAPLVGSRKIIEKVLKSLASPLPYGRMELRDIIDYAKDEGIIDYSMALKCHEIRKKGNKGAHELSAKAIDAQMVLELLDDFLRWRAEDLQLIPTHLNGDDGPNDPIFIVKASEEVDVMSKKARLAASLDESKEIEKKAQKARAKIEAFDDSRQTALQKMKALLDQANEIDLSGDANQDEEALAVQGQLFEVVKGKVEDLRAEQQALGASFDDVNDEIQEILNEHDFIRKLLRKDKQATVEQLGVMAFPRGSNSVTNILQIAGGAGTGKTLCLLAKIISEIDDHGQGSLFDAPSKKALFICFNKGLAKYVRGILDSYDGHLPEIEVISYDLFVNQLVRRNPRSEYSYLAEYAQDVRYSRGQIIYGSNDSYVEMLKEAQAIVAKHHPERARDYYLDSSDKEGFDWLREELFWIDARFPTDDEAVGRYPGAPRVGRGTKRNPSPAMKRIILEVWVELNKLLDKNGNYTINQATKRLLESNSLPAYDAIAIDEVQDFSLLSIRLLLRLRRSDGSKVFLSGDENQKIYQRDFTWKELDEGLKGHTITLRKNMRNSSAIRCFSDRLLGYECPYESACDKVHVSDADDLRMVELLRRLSALNDRETTVLISRRSWERDLRSAGVAITKAEPGNISRPGLYLIGDLSGKGLEFDNVVVDYVRDHSEDEEEEKRIRYVHFTRARKRLYIRYHGTPPKLLQKYYPDFLNKPSGGKHFG